MQFFLIAFFLSPIFSFLCPSNQNFLRLYSFFILVLNKEVQDSFSNLSLDLKLLILKTCYILSTSTNPLKFMWPAGEVIRTFFSSHGQASLWKTTPISTSSLHSPQYDIILRLYSINSFLLKCFPSIIVLLHLFQNPFPIKVSVTVRVLKTPFPTSCLCCLQCGIIIMMIFQQAHFILTSYNCFYRLTQSHLQSQITCLREEAPYSDSLMRPFNFWSGLNWNENDSVSCHFNPYLFLNNVPTESSFDEVCWPFSFWWHAETPWKADNIRK